MAEGVVINISGDTKEVEAAFKKLGQLFAGAKEETEKFGAAGEVAIGSFIGSLASQAVTGAFSLLKDAISGAISALGEFIDSGAESEAAVAKLNFALANTGKYSADASTAIQNYAKELQASSTVTDEAILKNAALIQSLGNLDEQGLKRATKASLDLSAAIGVDLESAAKILGKAADGNVESLKKFGIEVEGTGDKTKDFAQALTQLEAKFGGAAAAAAKTFEGALAQSKIALSDVGEEIGSAIIKTPALVGAIQGVTEVFNNFGKLITQNKDAISTFVTEGVDLFIRGIGLAGQGVNLFLDTLSIGNSVLTVVQNLIASVAQGYVLFYQAVFEGISAVTKFMGVNSEFVENAKLNLQTLNETLTEYKAQNTAEATEFVANNELRKQSITAFTETAVTAIRTKVDAQKAADIEEAESDLQKQNLMAQNRNIASEAELEYKRLFNEQLFAETQSTQGRIVAEEFRAQTQKLANEGKYQEAVRKIKAQQVKNEQDSIFAVAKYDELTQKQKLQNFMTTAQTISQLQKESSSEAFTVGKAFAAAQSVASGWQAVQNALASGPFPANVAMAAITAGIAARNTANILSAKAPGYAEGGMITGGTAGKDSVGILGMPGEIVGPTRSFDEIVEGTARQRGFSKGDENAELVNEIRELKEVFLSNPPTTNVNIQGDIIGEEAFVAKLGERLNDQVRFNNLKLDGT